MVVEEWNFLQSNLILRCVRANFILVLECFCENRGAVIPLFTRTLSSAWISSDVGSVLLRMVQYKGWSQTHEESWR
jgi:hypothetical protein